MKYTIENTTLTAVADKLREKTGTAEAITPEEMPGMVDEAFKSGEKNEWERFWDAYQNNGMRYDYSKAFTGLGWTQDTFRPKYDISPKRADYLFSYAMLMGGADLVTLLENCGVTLDFSKATNIDYAFDYSRIRRLGVIDTSSAARLYSVFSNSTIAIIDELILSGDGKQSFSAAFKEMSDFESVKITGIIGQNGFDVHWSTKLTHGSLMSIIDALADYSADTSGTVWKVTLGETNLAKLSEEEIGIAEAKRWVLA